MSNASNMLVGNMLLAGDMPASPPGGGRLSQALLLSAAISALMALQGAPARAQDTGSATGATANPDANGHAVAASAASTGNTLEEVLVTARRRSENLQVTPVSETAISGVVAEQLNVRNFQNLRGLVPNLEVTTQAGGGAALTIRGVGQTSNQVNVDVKTGYYVDEMYVARQEGNTLYFYDVGSLQVLNGPQGTLFGKNTTGGAILLTNVLPGPEPGGYLQVRAGNYSRLDTEGAINMPLSDQLMARFSFRTENADGFIKHVVDSGRSDNVNDKSGRLQIRWKPNSRFTADLLAEYNQSSTDGNTNIVTSCSNTASYVKDYNLLHAVNYCTAYPLLNVRNEVYGGATLSIPTSSAITDKAQGGDVTPGNLTRRGHPGSFNDTEVTTANMRLNYQLTNDVSLKSITTYRRSHAAFYNPTQNAPNDIYAEYDSTATGQFTEEGNISGRMFDGRLNFVAGFYYYSQNTAFVQDTGPDWIDPVGYLYAANNDFTSEAGYVQASYKILPPLELTVGVRYTNDHKSAVSNVYDQQKYGAPCKGFLNAFVTGSAICAGDVTGADAKSWSRLNPRVQLSYQFTPDIYLYGSLTTGYNAGGFNQQLGAYLGGHLIAYAPEVLTDYEAGLKTEWLDRRLRFNVTTFYQDYADIQTQVLVTYNGVATRAVQTGATAHEEGAEIEAEFEPTRDLLLRANASFLYQRYDSIAKGAYNAVTFNLSTPVTSAPRYTYAFDAAYTFHLASGGLLTPTLNWRAVGDKPSCNPPGACYLPAYGLLGGRMDFKLSPDSPWTASLYGTNLLDAKVLLGESQASSPAHPYGSGMGVGTYTPGRPREFGVEFTRRF